MVDPLFNCNSCNAALKPHPSLECAPVDRDCRQCNGSFCEGCCTKIHSGHPNTYITELKAQIRRLREAIQNHWCGHCPGCERPHPDFDDGLKIALIDTEKGECNE